MAAAASSSASFFGVREEDQIQHQPHNSSTTSSSAAVSTGSQSGAATAPQKKKRNLPGTPNPDSEVIALSPKTLLATNRFVCEVCNKGFQREQNLQLHRRGHNLPWKLRQKSTKEVRRKVYLCPEPTCVHHDPLRALGDLTGIKKHFCRKHGEKKWKCEKCSKRYAVQSDWKAHSKTCGTREYRCDCGTLFSRRDSFITHRAFCDALAQESARIPTGLSNMGLFANHNNNHNHNNNNMGLGLSQVNNSPLSSLQEQGGPSSSDHLRLGGNTGSSQFDHLLHRPTNNNSHSPFRPPPTSAFFLAGCGPTTQDFQEDPAKPFQGLLQLQNTSSATPSLFNLSFFANSGSSNSLTNSSNLISEQFNLMGADSSSLFNTSVHSYPSPVLPQISATALLQKAAQMGVTTSSDNFRGFVSSSKSESFSGNNNESLIRSQMESEANLQDLMNSLANGNAGIFGGSGASGRENNNNNEEGGFGRFTSLGMCEMDESKLHRSLSIGGGSDGLTRDFLGVGSVMRGLGGGGMPQREQHQLGSLDSELRSGSSSGRHFGKGEYAVKMKDRRNVDEKRG